MPEPQASPQGVVAVLIDRRDGGVIVHAACFERGGPAGFHQIEAQRLRARDELCDLMVKAFCGPRLGKFIGGGYELMGLLQRATHPERGEFCLTYIPIGYSDDEANLLR